jgi:hypothetical protein
MHASNKSGHRDSRKVYDVDVQSLQIPMIHRRQWSLNAVPRWKPCLKGMRLVFLHRVDIGTVSEGVVRCMEILYSIDVWTGVKVCREVKQISSR